MQDDETIQNEKEEEDTTLLSEVPIRETISSPDTEEWLDAMADEVVSIIKIPRSSPEQQDCYR